MVFETGKKGECKFSHFLEDFLRFAQQSVLLVDQTNIAVSYHRRLSALDDVMNNLSQAKSMLKTKSELLKKKDKDLFGKEFHDHISETVKPHNQFKELNFSKKRERGSFIWDRKPLEEGCNRSSLSRIKTRESICEQHISGKEKG